MLAILEDIDRRECIVMMGQQAGGQDRLFYSFNLDNHVPRDHLLRGIGHLFDADRGLLFRHSLRAQTVRRSSSESGLSLVLSPGTGGCSSGTLNLLEEQT